MRRRVDPGRAALAGALQMMGPAVDRINEIADQRDKLQSKVDAVQAVCRLHPDNPLATTVLALLENS